jgi:hypothetical protein
MSERGCSGDSLFVSSRFGNTLLRGMRRLKRGCGWSHVTCYRRHAVAKAASAHHSTSWCPRDFVYSAGWKRLERAWDLIVRIRQSAQMRRALDAVFGLVQSACEPPGATGRATPAPEASWASNCG